MLKKILKWLWEFVEILIIIYVIFITSCILCRNKFGYTQFGDMTFVTVSESNEKFFMNNKAGDLLIIKNQQMDLEVNDLIYYYVTVDEKYIVRTGVVDSKTQDDYAALYILRDDEGSSIASNRVIGKYAKTYRGKGAILDVLESRVGFLFLVLLPILVVFIYQIYQLVIVAKYEVVEDDEEEEEKKLPKKKKTPLKRPDEKNNSKEINKVEIKDVESKATKEEKVEVPKEKKKQSQEENVSEVKKEVSETRAEEKRADLDKEKEPVEKEVIVKTEIKVEAKSTEDDIELL